MGTMTSHTAANLRLGSLNKKQIPLQKINILKELAEYRHIRRVPIRQTTIHAPDAFSSALVDGLPALFRVGILVRDHGRVRDERP